MTAKPTAVDLFCGVGGLSLGLVRAGFDVLFAADQWDVAVHSYSRNFDHPALEVDLAGISGTELKRRAGCTDRPIDLVVGGPPCQGFSVQRIGDDEDCRNHLVLEFARLISELKPRLFLMENVPGLLGKRGRHLAETFEASMSAAGYVVRSATVNAADYGVPQIRRRVLYYGWQSGCHAFDLPEPTHTPSTYVTVHDAIGDLPPPPNDHSPHPDDLLHRETRLSPRNKERIALIPPGGGMQDLPAEMRVACHRAGAEKIGHRYVYGRLAPDRPASTITARFDSFTRGKFGHPAEPRNITLREGARLQTFPDAFVLLGTQEEIAALIGNAVPPRLAETIAEAAASWLSEPRSHDGGRPDGDQAALQQPRLPLFNPA